MNIDGIADVDGHGHAGGAEKELWLAPRVRLGCCTMYPADSAMAFSRASWQM
jgi:hypothetical protein